jgi:hypothetical protein
MYSQSQVNTKVAIYNLEYNNLIFTGLLLFPLST